MNQIRSTYKAVVLAGLAGLAALLTATSATAALPKKGGLYEWKKTNSASLSLVSWIKLQVRADGKSAKVIWSCNNAPPPTTISFKLKPDGSFKAASNPSGNLLLWYVQGRFISKTQAKVYLSLNVVCAGKGLHTTLNLRS
jgi:hypothetical protein